MANATELEEALNQPDRAGRLRALREAQGAGGLGAVRIEPPRPWVNMHCHSFHSYNAHGFSPSRIAWEAHRRGLAAAGVVDFDVLDGLDETLAAGDALRSKLTVGIETRVYIQDFARDVINSPERAGHLLFHGTGLRAGAAGRLARRADAAAHEGLRRRPEPRGDGERQPLPRRGHGGLRARRAAADRLRQRDRAPPAAGLRSPGAEGHARPRPPREILGRENPDAGAGSRGADERSGPLPRHAPQAPDEVRRPRLRAARAEEFPHAGRKSSR